MAYELDPTAITAALENVDDGLARAMSGKKRFRLDDQEVENVDPNQMIRARTHLQHSERRENGTIPTVSTFNFSGVTY